MRVNKTSSQRDHCSSPDSSPLVGLFDAYRRFRDLPGGSAMYHEYPDTERALAALAEDIPEVYEDLGQARDFLRSIGDRSPQTYNAFRGVVEKLLLWSWIQMGMSLSALRRKHIEAFVKWTWAPESEWISNKRVSRFQLRSGEMRHNPEWRPFCRNGKSTASLQNHNLVLSALSSFYDYMVADDYVAGSPMAQVRKSLRAPLAPQIKASHVLETEDWETILGTARNLADEDPRHERTLFACAMYKSLYLRVSELGHDSDGRTALWSQFEVERNGNIWFHVLGKGHKPRRVSVPEALLTYVARYREYLGLPAKLPQKPETQPLFPSSRSGAGLSTRQMSRIIKELFAMSRDRLLERGSIEAAERLEQASVHWLRHTGASMDIDERSAQHLADDLGHQSVATTLRVYVNSQDEERAASGKRRSV